MENDNEKENVEIHSEEIAEKSELNRYIEEQKEEKARKRKKMYKWGGIMGIFVVVLIVVGSVLYQNGEEKRREIEKQRIEENGKILFDSMQKEAEKSVENVQKTLEKKRKMALSVSVEELSGKTVAEVDALFLNTEIESERTEFTYPKGSDAKMLAKFYRTKGMPTVYYDIDTGRILMVIITQLPEAVEHTQEAIEAKLQGMLQLAYPAQLQFSGENSSAMEWAYGYKNLERVRMRVDEDNPKQSKELILNFGGRPEFDIEGK